MTLAGWCVYSTLNGRAWALTACLTVSLVTLTPEMGPPRGREAASAWCLYTYGVVVTVREWIADHIQGKVGKKLRILNFSILATAWWSEP